MFWTVGSVLGSLLAWYLILILCGGVFKLLASRWFWGFVLLSTLSIMCWAWIPRGWIVVSVGLPLLGLSGLGLFGLGCRRENARYEREQKARREEGRSEEISILGESRPY